VQARLGLTAAVIDRERIGIDQDLPHAFRSDGAVAERAAADPFRERGIAIAPGDLADGADHAAQPLFAPPRHDGRTNQCGDDSQKQAAAAPGNQYRYAGCERDWKEYPRRHEAFAYFGGHAAGVEKIPGGLLRKCTYSLTKIFSNAALQRTN